MEQVVRLEVITTQYYDVHIPSCDYLLRDIKEVAQNCQRKRLYIIMTRPEHASTNKRRILKMLNALSILVL